MDESQHVRAAEIGLRLPHSQETMEYLKRNNFGLHIILLKIETLEELEFTDFMILEYSGDGHKHYSCPLCKGSVLYSTAFARAKKHFESHLPDIDELRKKEFDSQRYYNVYGD